MSFYNVFYIGFVCIACNSAPVQQQAPPPAPDSGHTVTSEDPMPPAYDSMFPEAQEQLDEQTQMQIFKSVMKGVKVRELYDFSALENDRMFPTYQNLRKMLDRYRDSSDKRYTGFFSDFFGRLEQHEQKIARPDTPDIKTKLQIARIKSDIHAELASKKTAHIRP
jgi:hypothetical protein